MHSSGETDLIAEPIQSTAGGTPRRCDICLKSAVPLESRSVRCNVRRYRDRVFPVWRCATCHSLHCEGPEDLSEYYDNYPIRNQELDYFSRAWYRVVLSRLAECGLKKEDKILDYGCNKGLLLKFFKESGYKNCVGYDPYTKEFNDKKVLDTTYDTVISLDVIEHDADPSRFMALLISMMKPGGRLCIETPNADGIVLAETEKYLHALHVPYHVHILSQSVLEEMTDQKGLKTLKFYPRWYMDSWAPGTARNLFEALMMYNRNDLDAGYEPPRLKHFFFHPSLFFYLFFGYFLGVKKLDHMMLISASPA